MSAKIRFGAAFSIFLLVSFFGPLSANASTRICATWGPSSDLSNCNLSSKDLTNADLSGSNLAGADLRYADLSGANLTGANLTGATLSDCYFNDVQIAGVNFSGATLDGLIGPNLLVGTPINLPTPWKIIGGTLWGPGVFNGGDMTNLNLTGVDLSGSNLSVADFSNTNLTDVNFKNANLANAKLINSTISGADFSKALVGAVQSDSLLGTPSHLPDGVVIAHGRFIGGGADLEIAGSNAAVANLSGIDITGVDFSDVTYWNGAITGPVTGSPSALNAKNKFINGFIVGAGATLKNATLSHANLSNLDLSDSDLSGANLTGANLSGVKLAFTNLSNTNLTSANLSGLDFNPTPTGEDPSFLSGANLSGANLVGINLTGLDLTGINFTGAKLSNSNFSRVTGWDLHGSLAKALLKSTSITGKLKSGSKVVSPVIIKTTGLTYQLVWKVGSKTYLGKSGSFTIPKNSSRKKLSLQFSVLVAKDQSNNVPPLMIDTFTTQSRVIG